MESQAIETQSTADPRHTRLAALHASRLAFEAESRALKARLRSTWREPMGDAQRRLLQVQASLTDIYILLALARGRVHRRHEPRSWRGTERSGRFDPRAYALRVAERLAPELLSGEPS